ncbi:hypothetical protein KCU62_g212, partial [Aureobasidium sp. EXF-3399]
MCFFAHVVKRQAADGSNHHGEYVHCLYGLRVAHYCVGHWQQQMTRKLFVLKVPGAWLLPEFFLSASAPPAILSCEPWVHTRPCLALPGIVEFENTSVESGQSSVGFWQSAPRKAISILLSPLSIEPSAVRWCASQRLPPSALPLFDRRHHPNRKLG